MNFFKGLVICKNTFGEKIISIIDGCDFLSLDAVCRTSPLIDIATFIIIMCDNEVILRSYVDVPTPDKWCTLLESDTLHQCTEDS